MAFRTLSQRVKDAIAARDQPPNDTPPVETGRISNPRQHDIDRIVEREATEEQRKQEVEAKAEARRDRVSDLIRAQTRPAAPKKRKFPGSLIRQIQGLKRPGRG